MRRVVPLARCEETEAEQELGKPISLAHTDTKVCPSQAVRLSALSVCLQEHPRLALGLPSYSWQKDLPLCPQSTTARGFWAGSATASLARWKSNLQQGLFHQGIFT